MFLFIGLITGLLIGYKLNDLIKLLSSGIEFKIFAYKMYISKREKSHVVNIGEKKKQAAHPTIKTECATCKNEDMFIAGTKNLIPCPDCKRNASKFKRIALDC
ncbi:hypothetical protein GLV94_05450 [Virgibacillus halodenitrificans]|uniref:hypothetical protein n=1 Tax=Virgibacillus halodenitrificans TaxID=1482 RepID=UPI00136F8DA2|nr:hypothetical protein [Virgibacillus halodenitrificans]MYL45081.1 hypothetical protein [Virgibacillus halodenitrificans]